MPTGAHHVQRPGNEREEVAGDGEAAEGVRRKEPRDQFVFHYLIKFSPLWPDIHVNFKPHSASIMHWKCFTSEF